MTYNPILTDEEYLAQGFAPAEVSMVRRHDELFNLHDARTEKETDEMYWLIDVLGL